jgi:peroxiredoxin
MRPETGVLAVVLALAALGTLGACAREPGGGVAAVPGDPQDVRPLLPGMGMPAFTAPDPEQAPRRFDPAALERPLIVTFYRGGWCPYCSRHLMAYRAYEARLVDLGYELVFISPDRPEVSREHLEGSDFRMTVLADSDMSIAKAFGLAFRVDDETVRRYREEHDIDLEADSGYDHHLLPVPATFVVGRDGVIRFMYANPDYRVRLAPELLLTAARLAVAEEPAP